MPTLSDKDKFAKAIRDMWQTAVQNGLDKMTMEEINAEIAQYRKEKREQKPQEAEK